MLTSQQLMNANVQLSPWGNLIGKKYAIIITLEDATGLRTNSISTVMKQDLPEMGLAAIAAGGAN